MKKRILKKKAKKLMRTTVFFRGPRKDEMFCSSYMKERLEKKIPQRVQSVGMIGAIAGLHVKIFVEDNWRVWAGLVKRK
jgi:hypothetical protein